MGRWAGRAAFVQVSVLVMHAVLMPVMGVLRVQGMRLGVAVALQDE